MSTAAAVPAYAQVAAPAAPADEVTVGDIVVTAQRRSERLQDVPVAVTAVSPEVARKLGIQNIRDLNLATPSSDIGENNGSIQMFMRGIGTIYVGPGLEPPVATYLDGAYMQRTFGMNSLLDLVDPGTIEILRGPQGTLYGRNATGGAIRINSALPSAEREGMIAAEYGRFDHAQVEGMFNTPLSDTLSLRLAGRYTDDGGYITDTARDRKLYSGYSYVARGSLRWRPNAETDVVLGGEYQRSRKHKDAGSLITGAPICYACQFTGATAPTDYYETALTELKPWRSRMFRTWLNATYSFDAFDFTSTTSYEDDRTDQHADNDFTPADIFTFDVPGVGGKTFSQELQISSTGEGPFSYIAGVNYLHDKAFFNIALKGNAYAPLGFPEVYNDVKLESVSGFAEGTLKVTDQIRLTAGGRYTRDKRNVKGVNNAGFQAFGLPANFEVSPKQDAFTPRFVAAWDNGPTNVYYSFTRGFKAGGINTPATSPSNPIRPEKISSHEVGFKNTSMGGRLRTNLAAFYYKNKDLHVQIIDATSGGSITQNAGAAEGYGVELEMTAQPSDQLTIGGSLSYLHADYVSYPNASAVCYDPSGTLNPVAPGAVLYACSKDYSGRRVPHAPRYQASINASYDFNIGNWDANLSGVAQYRSSYDFFAGAGGDLGLDRQKGFVMANLSGYVSPPGSNMQLGFYVDNVFNEKYSVFTSTYQPYGAVRIVGEPITYGVRARYSY